MISRPSQPLLDTENKYSYRQLETANDRYLRVAIETLHDEGYVHGDFRGPNLLIVTDGLKLIDFDWCGRGGAARYPADINLGPDAEWHSGVYREGLITKIHDVRMFNLLVGSVRGSPSG